MTDSLLDKFQRLRRQAESLQRDLDQRKGETNLYLKQLKEEFDCKTIEEAKALLGKEKGRLQKLEKEYEKGYQEFQEKWGSKLEGESS